MVYGVGEGIKRQAMQGLQRRNPNLLGSIPKQKQLDKWRQRGLGTSKEAFIGANRPGFQLDRVNRLGRYLQGGGNNPARGLGRMMPAAAPMSGGGGARSAGADLERYGTNPLGQNSFRPVTHQQVQVSMDAELRRIMDLMNRNMGAFRAVSEQGGYLAPRSYETIGGQRYPVYSRRSSSSRRMAPNVRGH